jgi:hypothetical protein
MTVKELINELNELRDHDREICVKVTIYDWEGSLSVEKLTIEEVREGLFNDYFIDGDGDR